VAKYKSATERLIQIAHERKLRAINHFEWKKLFAHEELLLR
jgi:hypothetical protein